MKIFVVDDQPFIRDTIKVFLKDKFPEDEVSIFETGESALHELDEKTNAIILDFNLDSKEVKAHNGVEILKQIKKMLPFVPVIMLTANDHPSVAIDTIKYGAYDYVVKNENAFVRLQLLLGKIHGYNQLQKQYDLRRTINIVLWLSLAIITVTILVICFS